MSVLLARRLFTVAEYHRMAEAGILRDNDRVELIDGEIVENRRTSSSSKFPTRHWATIVGSISPVRGGRHLRGLDREHRAPGHRDLSRIGRRRLHECPSALRGGQVSPEAFSDLALTVDEIVG